MTIPYYEPYNGRRPIVERVPEFQPLTAGIRFHNGIFERPHGWGIATDWRLEPWVRVPNDHAAALTRDAIKCWAAPLFSVGFDVSCERTALMDRVEHTLVNAAAHALADALEIER